MTILVAAIGAVTTFLLAVIATTLTTPLIDVTGSSAINIHDICQALILVGPLGSLLIGIFAADGERRAG